MLTTATTIDPEQAMLGEVEMDGRDWWEEIHRRAWYRQDEKGPRGKVKRDP